MYNDSTLMPKLKLRFSANKGPFSFLVRMATWSKYSHVDFVLSNDKYLGAVPFKGVGVTSSKHPVEDFFEIEVTEEQYTVIMANAFKQLGKPYDYLGVVGLAFNRDWTGK